MNIFGLNSGKYAIGIVFIVVGCAIFLAVGIFLLIHFFLSPSNHKRAYKDLTRKYSYLHSLLIGQDAQYIHRLESASRTNLLYVETYNQFFTRFKQIKEVDDHFASQKIELVSKLIKDKQFKNIKIAIAEAQKYLSILEGSVNSLNDDLYAYIKPVEDTRTKILDLKEAYRDVKQTFYVGQNELELVSASFLKAFDKLDATFSRFDELIDSAEYDEANDMIPNISQVVGALKVVLNVMPNLCVLLETIIPNKISDLTNKYNDYESQGMPLFHLGFSKRRDAWTDSVKQLKDKLSNLQTGSVGRDCERIQNEIEEVSIKLDEEAEAKKVFETNNSDTYRNVIRLEKYFLKICSTLPDTEKIYLINDTQKGKIELLKANVNKLGASKRALDSFVHSGTKQPYTILNEKLNDLTSDYELVLEGVKEFRDYCDSLKKNCEEAYSMLFDYYYRLKETEELLKSINVPEFANKYSESINNCYDLLNQINDSLKVKPINVEELIDKTSLVKTEATKLFDDIDNKTRECHLAESAIVYANRDRNHQKDVDQSLSILEEQFFNGDFEIVYHNASSIYSKMHVKEGQHE